jgi:hypothetical protein
MAGHWQLALIMMISAPLSCCCEFIRKQVVKKRPDNGTTGFSFDFLKIICTDRTQTHTTTYTRIRTRLLLLLLLLRRRCSCASFALY